MKVFFLTLSCIEAHFNYLFNHITVTSGNLKNLLIIIVPEYFRKACNTDDLYFRNESCKGVITTGTGRFYSNGLDLEFLSTQESEDLANFFYSLMALLKRILMFPLPTLAAINGRNEYFM